MSPTQEQVLPRYGDRSLPDVVGSVLAALGVPGSINRLELRPSRSACLLLIDGLGWQLLHEHAGHAPFLASLATGATPITAGFPATTATSIASLGTGLPPGRHGIAGYTFAVPTGELLNALTWCSHPGRPRTDLRDRAVPELLQPHDTQLHRAANAGLEVEVLAPALQRDSGLTRAALRGATFRPMHALGDLAAGVVAALTGSRRGFAYAYHGDLDLLGHLHGPGSPPWLMQLGLIDRLVAAIAEQLPSGAQLVIVADHGMVTITDPVDVDELPELTDGVRLLGGDSRARHVYTEPGAVDDVLAAWRAVLGERAWVVSRAEAIAAGWFGDAGDAGDAGDLPDSVRGRFGDVLVAMRGGGGLLRRTVEPVESGLVGQHGSLTAAEQLVPLLVVTKK